jgi:iron complex outermembrane receptor protein
MNIIGLLAILCKNRTLLCFSFVVLAFQGTPSFAQDNETLELEEVIVTARKREESLNNVPISVSALTGEYLDTQAVTNMHDLADRIPNLQLIEAYVDEQIGIRGMSTAAGNQGFEQTVSLFIDGVYYGRGRWLRQGFFDMQTVEVLRGPQPVYFGKNTSAGALNLTSRNPGEEFESTIKLEYETEYDEVAAEATISGKLSETFGARLAVRGSDGDAWIMNTAGGPDGIDDREDLMARLSLVWTPSENVEIITKIQHADFSNMGRTSQIAICTPTLEGMIAAAGSTEDCKLNDTRTAGTTPDNSSAEETVEQEDYESTSFAVTANVNIDEYALTSVTAYTSYENAWYSDADFWDSPFFSIWVQRPEEEDILSQELRLVSPEYGAFSYVLGAYYASSDLTTENNTIWDLGPTASSVRIAEQDGDTWSVFGEVTFDISETWSASLGGRYTKDKKDITHVQEIGSLGDPYDNDPTAIFFLGLLGNTETNIVASRDSSNFSPSAVLNWTPNDGALFYASYSEGFKAGGFDHQASSQPENIDLEFIYDDEEAESFEIGGKLTLAGGAAQLNMALFHTEFTELQVATYDGVASFNIGNAGAATSKGFEVELQWRAAESLTLYGSLGYADAKYDAFPDAPCWVGQTEAEGCIPTPAPHQDLKGHTLARAPEWQGSIGLDWDQPITAGLILDIGANANYSSGVFYSTDLDPLDYQDDFWKVNVRAGINSSNGTWTLAVIAKNLFDKAVIANSSDVPLAAGSHWAMPGLPRTIYLQGIYRF